MLQPETWWGHLWTLRKRARSCLVCTRARGFILKRPLFSIHTQRVSFCLPALHGSSLVSKRLSLTSLRPGSQQPLDISSKYMALCQQKWCYGTHLPSSWRNDICIFQVLFSQKKITSKIECRQTDPKLSLCFGRRHEGSNDGDDGGGDENSRE